MKSGRKQKMRILATQAEMSKAVAAARRREKGATKIRHAHYDARRDVIVAQLSTGSILAVPRRIIPGLAGVRPRVLADLAITPGREGLWSRTPMTASFWSNWLFWLPERGRSERLVHGSTLPEKHRHAPQRPELTAQKVVVPGKVRRR